MNDGRDWHGSLFFVVSSLCSVAGEESLEHDEVPRYDLRVLWWKNGAVGSDTVEMTERSDVSDSRGTAGGAELQPEAALVGKC